MNMPGPKPRQKSRSNLFRKFTPFCFFFFPTLCSLVVSYHGILLFRGSLIVVEGFISPSAELPLRGYTVPKTYRLILGPLGFMIDGNCHGSSDPGVY